MIQNEAVRRAIDYIMTNIDRVFYPDGCHKVDIQLMTDTGLISIGKLTLMAFISRNDNDRL